MICNCLANLMCELLAASGVDGADSRLLVPRGNDPETCISWSIADCCVEVLSPRLTAVPSGNELRVSLRKEEIASETALFRFDVEASVETVPLRGTLSLDIKLDRTAPVLLVEENLELDRECRADLRVAARFRICDRRAAAVVTEDTQFRPIHCYSGTEAIYTRGAIAHPLEAAHAVTAVYRFVDRSTDKAGLALSMPVLAMAFAGRKGTPVFLAVATDPYYGMQATVSLEGEHTLVERECLYRGSVVPFTRQQRIAALEWTDRGADGIFNTFYRTVPEIAPAAPWVRNVAMGYYDYNGDDGHAWYNDLRTLAKRIPKEHRGQVACCLHGWYDRTGFYCYDRTSDTLASEWKAFDNSVPGRRPIPMSKSEMHRRISFAKELGFRVVLYYADCTNMTAGKVESSWCGKDYRRFLYTNRNGKQPAGWVGPCGGGLQLDISMPEVREWFLAYFRALLREYGDHADGFVLDETIYFSSGALCLRPGGPPAYGDLAQMRFIRDLAVLVQQHRARNADLCLFEGSHYLYGLVSHGSFTDFEGIPLVVNYRNTSIQCCWDDPGIRNVHCKYRTDPAYDYPFGLDVGLSNGWASDMGPSEMPAARLDEVIAHFRKRATEGPPCPKIATIACLEALLGKSSTRPEGVVPGRPPEGAVD